MNLTELAERIATEDLIVRFTADWCAPCRSMAPVIDEIRSDGHTVVDIDIDANPEIAKQFDVMSIPTFIGFKNGERTGTTVGAAAKPHITQLVA